MLANPQNLDIGAFLETPSESPFAVALRASQIVLVIPNRHQSDCEWNLEIWGLEKPMEKKPITRDKNAQSLGDLESRWIS